MTAGRLGLVNVVEVTAREFAIFICYIVFGDSLLRNVLVIKMCSTP